AFFSSATTCPSLIYTLSLHDALPIYSVLAMSGLETLAQVYREIEHPKLPNLKKTAVIIFIYSLVFTSLVSFFASAIIPDDVRMRSEEHTSELQSRFDLVCRLLLEKKK